MISSDNKRRRNVLDDRREPPKQAHKSSLALNSVFIEILNCPTAFKGNK